MPFVANSLFVSLCYGSRWGLENHRKLLHRKQVCRHSPQIPEPIWKVTPQTPEKSLPYEEHAKGLCSRYACYNSISEWPRVTFRLFGSLICNRVCPIVFFILGRKNWVQIFIYSRLWDVSTQRWTNCCMGAAWTVDKNEPKKRKK